MGEQLQTQLKIVTTAEAPVATTTTNGEEEEEEGFSTRNTSKSGKIPFRPRKIRKLSTEATNCKSPQSDAVVNPKSATATTSQPNSGTISRSLSSEGEIDVALRHLRSSDPLLAPLIDLHRPPSLDSSKTPFLALARSILYQQLATKAATSIYNRFLSLCGGQDGVVPETVLALTPHQLRQVGVSGRKASYLHDLSKKYQTGVLSDSSIVEMDDKSLFTKLTMVNGIGPWSVHMFMIFSLHRPDVLPVGDLGVRKGVQLLYGLEGLPRPSQMDQLCEKWRPYCSVGSWYMWRLVEAKGAPSNATTVAAAVSASL